MKKHMFFGIEVERKVDILAFFAFLISVCTISIKLYGHINGANVILQTPNQIILKKISLPEVTITKNKLPPEKQGYVNFVADMIYYNSGSPGYNDSIKSETATLRLNGESFYYKWQYFAVIDEKDGKLIEGKKEIAGPRVIKAKEAELHETHFFPTKQTKVDGNINIFFWGDFIDKIIKNKSSEFFFQFHYTTYGGKMGSTSCKVLIDDSFIKHIEDKEWTSVECIELSEWPNDHLAFTCLN